MINKDRRKDRVVKDGETLLTSSFLHSYPNGMLSGI